MNFAISSGETAKATTSNAEVDVIAASAISAGSNFSHVRIRNGTAATSANGFFSLDGLVWHDIAAGEVLTWDGVIVRCVQVKRIADGTNLAGVYASAW